MTPANQQIYRWKFVINVAVRAVILFTLVNILFALIYPLDVLGSLSVYNWLVPGRERLPYGENPASYNLSLYDLNAMFNSHVIAAPRKPDEFHVVVVGDSSVWGVQLNNRNTLTEQINVQNLQIGGRKVYTYNIGYPLMSATKDFLLLDYALRYQPDMVVWLTTLESLYRPKQLDVPLIKNNPDRVRDVFARYDLSFNITNSTFVDPDFWGQTLIGQRRALADWWRLQLLGFNWAFTEIDQYYGKYKLRSNDLNNDQSWQNFAIQTLLSPNDLAFDILETGYTTTAGIPLLLVNEPIFRADGTNNDLRYNTWYPRWAYDQYRELIDSLANEKNWNYVDMWDAIEPTEFTDSPVHLSPNGSYQLSQRIGNELISLASTQSQN